MLRTVLSAISAITLWSSLVVAQPIESFASLPDLVEVEISPDGRWMATRCTIERRRHVCTYRLDGQPGGQAVPIPENGVLYNLEFGSARHLILSFEFFQRLNTISGIQEIPVFRSISINLDTGEHAVIMRNQRWSSGNNNIVSLDRSDPDHVLIEMTLLYERQGMTGSNIEREARLESRLFRVNLDDGGGRPIDRGRERRRIISPDGEILAYVFSDPETFEYEIRRESVTGPLLFSGVFEGLSPRILGFTDEETVLMGIITGEQWGYHRLNLNTGELTRNEQPGGEPMRGPIFDRYDNLIGTAFADDGKRRYVYFDEELTAITDALREALGDDILIEAMSDDRNIVAFSTRGPAAPPQYLLFDRAAGEVSPIGSDYPGLENRALPERRLIRYEASDGLEIRAVMTTPVGWTREDGPLPLVMLPHGGPAAQDTTNFDWWAQAYAAQGYLVLQPNFRGSTGRGQAFREAGFGEFGGRMIEDILDGARHVQAEGYAQPGPYCVVGGSYGGYAALMAAIRAPGEVACVVAFAPVTDPLDMLGQAYRYGNYEAVEYWEDYMGDRFQDAGDAMRITPADRTERLTMPVLLIHGTDDTVVPISQSENLVRNLPEQNQVRFERLGGEDHFLSRRSSRVMLLRNSIALFEETIAPPE